MNHERDENHERVPDAGLPFYEPPRYHVDLRDEATSSVLAHEQYIYVERASMPSSQSWQEAIDATGYRLQLNHHFKACQHSGYLPCLLGKTESGFEVYFPESKGGFLRRWVCGLFRGGEDGLASDASEEYFVLRWSIRDYPEGWASAMIAALAMMSSHGARAQYEADPHWSIEELRANIDQTLAKLKTSQTDSS